MSTSLFGRVIVKRCSLRSACSVLPHTRILGVGSWSKWLSVCDEHHCLDLRVIGGYCPCSILLVICKCILYDT